MALIRQADAFEATKNSVSFSLADVAEQARSITDRATDEAARIVADARAERDRIMEGASETGYEEGLQRGKAEGLEIGRAEGEERGRADTAAFVAEVAQNWTEAAERINTAFDGLLDSARAELMLLSLDIARRVTKLAIDADTNAAVEQLNAALALLLDRSRIAVTVNPADRDALAAAIPAIEAAFGKDGVLSLKTDDALAPGSVVVATPDGAVDASIDTQLDAIARILTGASVRPETRSGPVDDDVDPEVGPS